MEIFIIQTDTVYIIQQFSAGAQITLQDCRLRPLAYPKTITTELTHPVPVRRLSLTAKRIEVLTGRDC
jgi:hypothetical protein